MNLARGLKDSNLLLVLAVKLSLCCPYTESTTWAHDFPGQPLGASTLRTSLLKRPSRTNSVAV